MDPISERIASLSPEKRALLLRRLSAERSRTPSKYVEPSSVTGTLPLTPIQHWFFEFNFPNETIHKPHWSIPHLFEILQPVDPILIEQAAQYVLNYHDALRVSFVLRDSTWRQDIADRGQRVPFTRYDYAALTSKEQNGAIERAVSDQIHSIDLFEGPLLRVSFFDLGPKAPSRLLIVIHHLAVDGVSGPIVIEDLLTAYNQLSEGKEVILPVKTTSFQEWAYRLSQYAKSGSLNAELKYWITTPRTQVRCLPMDNPFGENTNASGRDIHVALSNQETKTLLRDVAVAYRIGIEDILLMAITQALIKWTGVPHLLIDQWRHGREVIFDNMDVSRTVGWFNYIRPVFLDLEGCTDKSSALQSVIMQLKNIPQAGVGYGLLRYCSGNENFTKELRSVPQPEISYNFRGTHWERPISDQAIIRSVKESTSHGINVNNRRYLLEINGGIYNGILSLTWSYSANIHRRATIESLAASLIEALSKLQL